MSGFMAAFAGVLYVHHQSGLGVAAFLPYESLNAFSMVVIGGLGSLSGALLGAFYVRGAQYFLPGNWAQLASGAGLLLVLMILPGGIGAAIADVRDAYLRWVANRRGLLVPSLVADRREEPVEIPAAVGGSRSRGRRVGTDPGADAVSSGAERGRSADGGATMSTDLAEDCGRGERGAGGHVEEGLAARGRPAVRPSSRS